ncbi:MAG: hypothetical protein R2695_20465 [Acidimicrobiales bacterium]
MITSNPYAGDRRAGTSASPPGVRCDRPDDGTLRRCRSIGRHDRGLGPNVCAGYWRNPEKTAGGVRADGYFVTGDLGLFDAPTGTSPSRAGARTWSSAAGSTSTCGRSRPSSMPCLDRGVGGRRRPHPDLGEAVVAVVVAEAGGIDESGVVDVRRPVGAVQGAGGCSCRRCALRTAGKGL